MAKQVTEVQAKLTADVSDLKTAMKQSQVATDAITRSLEKYTKQQGRNTKASNDATIAEKKITSARDKHAASIRNVSSNLATMTGPLNNITGRISAFGALIQRVGAGAAVAGAGFTALATGAVIGFKKTFAATVELEKRQLKLQGALNATGYAAGFTADELNKLTASVAADTLASLDGVGAAVTALTSFKKINSENFERTIRLGQDLATTYGQDLTTSVRRLGIALQDPIGKYASLERVGVKLSESQVENIKLLQEQGDLFGAQAIILDEIQGKVGGIGKAAGLGLAGSFDLLDQRGQEFFESLGKWGAAPTEIQGAFSQFLSTWAQGAAKMIASVSGALVTDIAEVNAELNSLQPKLANNETLNQADALKETLIESIRLRGDLNDPKSMVEEKQNLKALNALLAGQNLTMGEAHYLRRALNATRSDENEVTQIELNNLAEQVARYNSLGKVMKTANEEKRKAAAGKADAEALATEEAKATKLKENQELYKKLFASVGEGYEKQRRTVERVHQSKIDDIKKLSFLDEQVAALGVTNVEDLEGLKLKLMSEAIVFKESQLKKIDKKEENATVAERNRALKLAEDKRKIEFNFREFEASLRGEKTDDIEKWRQDQLTKLAEFKAQSAKLEGVDVDTAGKEAQIDEQAEVMRAKRKSDAIRNLQLEDAAIQASLTKTSLDDIDANHAIELQKLMGKLESGKILKEEFDTSEKLLSLKTEAEKNKAKLEEERSFQQAMLDIKNQSKLFQASLTESEFDDLDIKHEIQLQKLKDTLEQELITHQEYAEKKKLIDAQAEQAKTKAEEDEQIKRGGSQGNYTKAIIALKKGETGALTSMAEMVSGAMASGSKKAFAIKKALAIKEAVMATYHNAVLAFQSLVHIPVVGPALGTAAAAGAIAMGMTQVNSIRSQTVTGARKSGGQVLGGKNYLVGENGPEIATFGATSQITSFENAQKAFGIGNTKQSNVSESSGGSLNAMFNIKALDAPSVKELLADPDSGLYEAMSERMAEMGKTI